MNGDGSDRKWVFFDPAGAAMMSSWSPDGQRMGLRLLNLGNHSVKALTTEWDNFPFWSPSGDRILFTRQKIADKDFDVFVMRPDGSDLVQLTTSRGTDGHANWTADGKSILFMSSRSGFKDEASMCDNSPQPYAQVFIMKPDGSDVRQLTDSRWEDSMPVFGPASTLAVTTR